MVINKALKILEYNVQENGTIEVTIEWNKTIITRQEAEEMVYSFIHEILLNAINKYTKNIE